MSDPFLDVDTIDDCIDIATVDSYNDDELAAGWLCCLEEVLGGITQVKLLGDIVEFKKLDLNGNQVIAVCLKDGKAVKVTLDSVELIKPSRPQRLWMEAWARWSKG